MKRDIASRLRLAREAKGWPQWHLAEGAKVDGTYLSLIEQGRRHPSPRVAQRIADPLGLAVTDLFTTLEPEKVKEESDAPTADATRSE